MDEEQRAQATGAEAAPAQPPVVNEPGESPDAAPDSVAQASTDAGTPDAANGGAIDPLQDETAPLSPTPAVDAGPPALTLVTLGTPHGGWAPLARAALEAAPGGTWLGGHLGAWLDDLLGPDAEAWPQAAPAAATLQSPDGATRWGALDERACWALDALLEGLPQARFLVFVDTPEAALATWLRRGAPGSAQAALAQWTAGARRLLERSARARARFTFIDAAAASRDPLLLTDALQRLLGAAPQEWQVPAPAVADATVEHVAAALAADAAEAHAVGDALLALCKAPAAIADTPTSADVALQADAEGESIVERFRGLAGSAADAQQRRELERDALERALKGQREAAALVRAELRRERAAHARTRTELEATRGKLGTANMERAVVIRQVLDTQRELARYFGEYRRLELSAGPVSARIRANRVVFGPTVSDGPHRHIDVHAHGLRSPSQELHDQLVRLVDHHGRPGIALLNTRGKPAPLGLWEPNIDEGARSGLLIVPADAPSRALLERLGTADWITVLGLVNLLESELAISRIPQAAAWRVVAHRLLMQLRELPARLRYDRCTLTPVDDRDPAHPQLRVAIESPMYGEEVLAPIHLLWSPKAHWSRGEDASASLQWLLPSEPGSAPALANWPVEPDGRPAARLALPVGPGLGGAAKRQRWQRLSASERALLLGLLDTLCGSAGDVEGAALPAGWSAARLAAAAAELRTDAQTTLRSLRLRQRLPRILGRA